MNELVADEIRPVYYQWTDACIGELEEHCLPISVPIASLFTYLKIFSIGQVLVEFIHEDDSKGIEYIFEVLTNPSCLKA